jgi:hypothetical protein
MSGIFPTDRPYVLAALRVACATGNETTARALLRGLDINTTLTEASSLCERASRTGPPTCLGRGSCKSLAALANAPPRHHLADAAFYASCVAAPRSLDLWTAWLLLDPPASGLPSSLASCCLLAGAPLPPRYDRSSLASAAHSEMRRIEPRHIWQVVIHGEP